MIVRILGEGQFSVSDGVLDRLNDLDEAVVAAIESGDHEGFHRSLQSLLGAVRTAGTAVPADHLAPSDLVLPGSDSTLEEVRALLSEEGLIPG
jgi:hypothetical protein